MNGIKSLYQRILITLLILMFSIITIYFVGILEFGKVKNIINPGFLVLLLTILLFLLMFVVIYIFICKPIKLIEESVKRLNIKSKDSSDIDTSDFLDVINNLNHIIANNEEELLKEQSLEILNQKIHFTELQNQINPHFLYNTLESIRGQAIEDNNYIISNMTEALAKYFRYSISNNNDIVKFRDELQNVKNYIEIQKYRFEDKIYFEMIFDENDEHLLNSNIPKLTLQPIVENAIYYGLESKEGVGKLVIRVEKTQDRVIIIITDDGVGIDCNTLYKLKKKISGKVGSASEYISKKGNGIAMTNVNNRLKLLFGDEYGLNISSTVGLGTEVEIVIPIKINSLIQ